MTGPATASTLTGAVAGPPDLAHAIQAAMVLREMAEPLPPDATILLEDERAAILAGADALEQLQATRDRLADLQGTNATIGNDLDQANTTIADHRSRIESLCDQLADLQVYAAELHDLLAQVWELHGGPEGTALWITQPFGQKVGAALQADPPARGRAILEEVKRLREVAEAARPFAGPVDHGYHLDDCQPDYVDEPEHCHPSCPQPRLRAALATLDLGAAQEDDSRG